MTMRLSETMKSRFKRRRMLGWLVVLGGVLILPTALVIGIYVFNNRVPDLQILTRVAPTPNAFDYFVRAGQMVLPVKHLNPYSLPMAGDTRNETYANFKTFSGKAAPALLVLGNALSKPYL